MSDLGNTTAPIEKPVDHAEKIDQVKKDEGVAAKEKESENTAAAAATTTTTTTTTESKGKGKGKAVESHAETDEDDDDDDDDDDNDEEEDEEEDDEDDLEMDEVDPSDIIPPSTRRSARSGQIDYSSEEALKKAGLAAKPIEEDEDGDFKGDDTMEDE